MSTVQKSLSYAPPADAGTGNPFLSDNLCILFDCVYLRV